MPMVRVEARRYVRRKVRLDRGRNISGNTGNFFSLSIDYNPDLLIISNYDVTVDRRLEIIPGAGIRRVFFGRLATELGLGAG